MIYSLWEKQALFSVLSFLHETQQDQFFPRGGIKKLMVTCVVYGKPVAANGVIDPMSPRLFADFKVLLWCQLNSRMCVQSLGTVQFN